MKQVIQSETAVVFGAYRTQLFSADNMKNVKKFQAGYKVQPLTAIIGQPVPQAAPETLLGDIIQSIDIS